MVEAVYLSREANHDTSCLYFDFQRAFDCIDHSILLHKLAKFGFDDAFLHFLVLRYLSVHNVYMLVTVFHSRNRLQAECHKVVC